MAKNNHLKTLKGTDVDIADNLVGILKDAGVDVIDNAESVNVLTYENGDIDYIKVCYGY